MTREEYTNSIKYVTKFKVSGERNIILRLLEITCIFRMIDEVHYYSNLFCKSMSENV